jgi:ubiquinone/menaquinone biosynthesis C-methylase UbiE
MIVQDRSGPPSKQRHQVARLRSRLGSALPDIDECHMQTTSENALFAQICIEEGDEEVDLIKVRDRLVRLAARLGVYEIVMTPFGHLSEKPAKATLARTIIDNLIELTRERFSSTKETPFGWDKSLTFIDVPCHPRNISGMYFYFDTKNPWDELAGDYDDFMADSLRYNAQFGILDDLTADIRPPILELCCGTGRLLHHLRSRRKQKGYVGIDSSEEMIWLAEKMESAQDIPNGKDSESAFICGRAEDVGKILQGSRFNTIVLSNAAPYIDIQKILKELPNVMIPGANLIFLEEQSDDGMTPVMPIGKRLQVSFHHPTALQER